MTTDRELTRIVRAWLRTDEHESADRVLNEVLGLIDSNSQHRPWLAAVQLPHLRRSVWLGLVAAAALVVALVGFPALLPDLRGPGSSPSPSVAPAPSPTGPTPSVRPSPVGDRIEQAVDGTPFSFVRPAGWSDFSREYPNYITKSVRGPQGAEAVIFWTVARAHEFAEPCYYLRTQAIGEAAADLAAVVASVPGTDLVSGPTLLTVGGRTAQHVVFVVREDVGCDPGFFFTYPNLHGGALWPETWPGDTVRVWVVQLDGQRFFIEAKTHPDAGAALEEQIQLFIDSVRFE